MYAAVATIGLCSPPPKHVHYPQPFRERTFAIREKMPTRAPPPPPPNTTTTTTTPTTLSPHLPPPHFIPTGSCNDRLEFEKLFSSASVSPVLRRRMWQAAATTGNFTFKSPPPLPVRGASENKPKETVPKQETAKGHLSTSEENQVPPPLPPRQSVFDPAEVELRNKFNAAKSSSTANKKYGASTNSQLPKKHKSPSQSFWRTFKSSKSTAAISKVFPSASSSSKCKDPPPLPPRQASVTPCPRAPPSEEDLKEEATEDNEEEEVSVTSRTITGKDEVHVQF
ncbi:rho GTPase-activating protein gacO-like [Lytechinus pictus]|uniref:rho GTPase-activating protein gacO-like n=1 Tax=Lytechinus pictus TaxID=7653 RepID=UPI0030B9E13E